MVLKSQLYPQVSYAQTGGYCTTNSYDQCQEDYHSQQEDYCSENVYCNSGSSMQQMKPYPNIATPQPVKHQVFGYRGYDDQNQNHQNYNDYNISGYDKHSKGKHQIDGYHNYNDHNINGYDKQSKGKHHNCIDYGKHSKGDHHGDGFYGKTYGAYDNQYSHGYAKYQNGPNSYETMSCNGYYTESERCSPYYGHENQQNWASKGAAEWISKSLDD